jgi:hypothetical protein
MNICRHAAGLCAILLIFGACLTAQVPYSGVHFAKGQDVSPVFEGWESNPDGTFTLHFGYFNRNSEEELDVPIGPDNSFDMGNGDQGQPTHFYPGRKWFVFKVVVPKDWPLDKRAVWKLTTNGRTNQSKGWLQPEWEVDKALITKNAVSDRSIGIWNVNANPDNKAPVITGSSAQTVTLPATATLTATATDDGIPKPGSPGRGGRPQGPQIRWILYRGPAPAQAKVQFDPEVTTSGDAKPLTSETKVTFSMPGNYRLRAIASDGSLFSTFDVDVKVNPPAR